MTRTPIKKGQVWEHKVSKKKVWVDGKKGSAWRIKEVSSHLTPRSIHTVANQTLWTKFNLIS